jgi:phage terminase large subunit-like protein
VAQAAAKADSLFDWQRYGRDVVAGRTPVCKWVRLAVERHYRDLADGAARGLWFSEEHAQHALEFFLYLRHSKGEWAGRQFELSPWQQFWTAVQYGWMRADGTRRFREADFYVPRKNGKSTWISGQGLYLFLADGEGGAEVYTAATKRDQAKITYDEAVRMVKGSPALSRHVRAYRDRLQLRGQADKLEPLGRDSDTMDGLNPHGALIDEFHAHPNRATIDVLKTGMGARRQPMLVVITTAGDNLASPAYEQMLYGQKVLEQLVDDDDLLVVIYTLDEESEYVEPGCWIKANPNLGVSVYPSYLKSQVDTAQKKPIERNGILTKNFNIWVSGEVTWISTEKWRACADASLKLEAFAGVRNVHGLDLASKVDIAADVQVFERREDDGLLHYYAFARHYIPEARIDAKDNASYDAWRKDGWLIATSGDVIDFDLIETEVQTSALECNSEAVAFDPWQAQQMANHLVESAVPMVEIHRTVKNLSAPMKELQALVLEGASITTAIRCWPGWSATWWSKRTATRTSSRASKRCI